VGGEGLGHDETSNVILFAEELTTGARTMTEEYPPQIAKIALVLSAILWIATMGYAMTHLNSIDARPTNQPSTQAPDDNTKAP
jgi:hypothetical protein